MTKTRKYYDVKTSINQNCETIFKMVLTTNRKYMLFRLYQRFDFRDYIL